LSVSQTVPLRDMTPTALEARLPAIKMLSVQLSVFP
jgi:hypothetical protein